MDTVPYAFVRSLMETLLVSENLWSLEHVEAATTCSIETPGVFFKTPFNEDRLLVKAPVYEGMLLGDARRPPVPAKNLLQLNVFSQSLFFEGDDALLEGTSIRQIRRLVEQCRHVPIRELIVQRFSSAAIPQTSIALIPDLTTFFNRVALDYYDTDSYREFLLALVEAKRLERLDIYISSEDGFPNATSPHWFQETILKAFFQPQLQELKIYFKHYSWIPSALLDSLIRDWLRRAETFPETTRTLDILGAPPFRLLESFRSTGETHHKDSSLFARRRFLMPHPQSTERMLEVKITVFTPNNEATEAFSDEEFIEKANFSRIRFHFNRGQNAMYWRTLRTTSITKKPRVKKPWAVMETSRPGSHHCAKAT
uniref:FTH domain-containing protein n=1 Tax=Steinernema glaseri TaxID=37863 RepID=A0A1I7XY13_9BILA